MRIRMVTRLLSASFVEQCVEKVLDLTVFKVYNFYRLKSENIQEQIPNKNRYFI